MHEVYLRYDGQPMLFSMRSRTGPGYLLGTCVEQDEDALRATYLLASMDAGNFETLVVGASDLRASYGTAAVVYEVAATFTGAGFDAAITTRDPGGIPAAWLATPGAPRV